MRPQLQFTAHNVQLPDGSRTLGSQAELLSESPQTRAIVGVLKTFFPTPSQTTVADLGCLEGGYALEFARNGFQATGIEVRQSNVDNCLYLKEQTGLENLNFIQDDVRNLAQHGPFDSIFCCGLFYHLDKPFEFLNLLVQQTRKLLILQTHYARAWDPLYDLAPLQVAARVLRKLGRPIPRTNYRLSRLDVHEGIRGRWFPEFKKELPRNEQEKLKWASWENPKSFWMVKEDLLHAIKEAGFAHVFEQFDHVRDPRANTLASQHDRGLFIGVKA